MATDDLPFWKEKLEQSMEHFVTGVELCGRLRYGNVALPAAVAQYLRDHFAPNFEGKVTEGNWPTIADAILTTAGFMGFVAAENALARNSDQISKADARLCIDAALQLCMARFASSGFQALCEPPEGAG